MPDKMSFLRDAIGRVQGVVFDMDGVIIDSEGHHFLSHQKALAEFGINIDKPFYIDHGISIEVALFYSKAFNKEKLPAKLIEKIFRRKTKIYNKLQREEGIIPIKPAINLIRIFCEKKIPLALASTVCREEVNSNLQHLGIGQFFSALVAGDDFMLRKKPFPDIYLKAAELLGISPRDCIAVEDSGNGAAAAVRAGMTCLVVPNDYTKGHTFAKESFVFDSFPELQKIVQAFLRT